MLLSSKFTLFVIIAPLIVTCFYGTDGQIEGDYEEKYTFLVQGGYRPQEHGLAKYIVSIKSRLKKKFFGDNHICGGSIITVRSILTAAHCVVYKNSTELKPLWLYLFKVVAGTPDLFHKVSTTRIYDVDKVAVYPDFEYHNHTGDLAILHLKQEIEIDPESRTIIPLIDYAATPGTRCTLFGWGKIFKNGPRPAVLIYLNLTILDCKWLKPYKLCLGSYENFETSSGGGDSGGPLICDGKLAGVLSSSEKLRDQTMSVYRPLLTYFINVWHYKDWIEKTAMEHSGVIHFEMSRILALCCLGNVFLSHQIYFRGL